MVASRSSDDDWNEDSDCHSQDDPYVDCPHCGSTILEDADYCPVCDRWLTDGSHSSGKSPGWVVVVALILLVVFITTAIMGF